MQNQPQNPNDNLNNPLQLKSEQVAYIIEVSMEQQGCVEFVQWLKAKGHEASIVDSECSFVNGTPDFMANVYFIYKGLYSDFLRGHCGTGTECAVCGASCDSKFCPQCGNCVTCQI